MIMQCETQVRKLQKKKTYLPSYHEHTVTDHENKACEHCSN